MGPSTASIVSYSLIQNGTPRTRLLSQFDGEKHLLHEHDSPNAPDKSSACMHVIIGQLPWDPSATHFPKPEVIMDSIVCRAVTHVEFYENFINSNSP